MWSNITLPLSATTPRIWPVTLYGSWSTLTRFLILLSLNMFGIFFNGVFVSIFFVGRLLFEDRNVYVFMLGLSEFLNVALVLPTAFFVFISNSKFQKEVSMCHFIQSVVIAGNYNVMLFSMMKALEIYLQQHFKNYVGYICTNGCALFTSVLILIISCTVSVTGYYFDYFFDYCTRIHQGDMTFRLYASSILLGAPSCITLFLLLSSVYKVLKRFRHVHNQRSRQFIYHRNDLIVHFAMYLIFLICWGPFFVVIYKQPHVTDLTFYTLAWLGYMRSVLSGILYILSSKKYRQWSIHVIGYICCKIPLPSHANHDFRSRALHRVANPDNILQRELTPREAMDHPPMVAIRLEPREATVLTPRQEIELREMARMRRERDRGTSPTLFLTTDI